MNTIRRLSKTPLKASLYFYAGVVSLGAVKGAISACNQYWTWRQTRTPVTINSPMYDPIINSCRDVGYWGFNALQAGVGSAIIVATSPVSIPLILMNAKDNDKS